jgi:hypothetical protein
MMRIIRPEAGEEIIRVLRLNAQAFFDLPSPIRDDEAGLTESEARQEKNLSEFVDRTRSQHDDPR